MRMTRRQFVSVTANATAAAALGARVAHPRAATWDLVVQGGRVIDPSLGDRRRPRRGDRRRPHRGGGAGPRRR